MAIFAKEEGAPETKNGAPAGEGAMSIIAAGMTVTGDIDSAGVVKIEGRVEGSVRSARQVLVGRQGEVKGDIETREAVIGGRVEGTITASERSEIQGTASVSGDIQTKSILVQEGGKINGRVVMMDGAMRPADARIPTPKPQPMTVAR
jgi:cytoskeletal protein CcmA (bactofilin family)